MMVYIRRSIITSPGCQNDPVAEIRACGLESPHRQCLYPAAAGGTVVSPLELVQSR